MAGRRLLTFLVVAAALGACEPARTDDAVARAGIAGSGTAAVIRLPAPADSEIPEGALGVSIRRGRALLAATRDSLPAHVGGQLNCTSCHLDEGTRVNAAPLVGVYARFPQYRDRSNSVAIIEDRVNDSSSAA